MSQTRIGFIGLGDMAARWPGGSAPRVRCPEILLRQSRRRRMVWRRGRDSNPRYPCEYSAFRVRCHQPLDHLSSAAIAGPSLENRPAECIRHQRRRPGGSLEAAAALASTTCVAILRQAWCFMASNSQCDGLGGAMVEVRVAADGGVSRRVRRAAVCRRSKSGPAGPSSGTPDRS